MTDELPPLDPTLRELLEHERARPEPDRELAGEVWAKVAGTLGFPKGPGDGGDGGGDGGGPDGGGTPGAAPGAGDAASSFGSALASVLSQPAGWVVLGAGAVLGAGVHATLAPEPAPREPIAAPSVTAPPVVVATRNATVPPAPSVEVPPPESAPSATPRTPSARSTARAPASATSTPAARDRALAEENALIARAQSALARRKPDLALEALREHARRFPRGQLADEREALEAQARSQAERSP